jgi:hypothetical protein
MELVVERRRQRIKVLERRRKVSWNMIIGKLELYIILSYVMKLLFFGIIGVLQGKRSDKAESSTESEPIDATTNGAASHPKIEGFFFFFGPSFFNPLVNFGTLFNLGTPMIGVV